MLALDPVSALGANFKVRQRRRSRDKNQNQPTVRQASPHCRAAEPRREFEAQMAQAKGSFIHDRLRLIRLATKPAPKPLSMLTTVTFDAQELSIPSRAAIPPKDAP